MIFVSIISIYHISAYDGRVQQHTLELKLALMLQVGVDFEGGVAFADSDVVVVAAGAEVDVGFRSFA